ncbi:MAG TPA: tetratricopeptide repeat protein [Thermoanaerobaculia bacterium]|nr:tetratricopeptide repeat protein [Thermoanaerobaculia bacterium]
MERQGSEDPGATDRGMRIVVLPFENLGKPEDAFFADGLTEEITKDLASFPSLQVISRTSALRYTGTRKTLPEIGRELGVDYVLEGTVRWAPGSEGRSRVRITPQLIRAEDDTHLWADAFEREVEDIFEVQAEISHRVITQLGITLMPEDRESLRRPPTGDLEAYRAYLRGLELRNQPFYSEKHLLMAVPMLERAVELDPEFADAWAELSQTHSYLAFNADPSPIRVEKARQALQQGVALAPNLRSVRLAQAYFAYRCLGDFESAHKILASLVRSFPNDAEALQSLGFVLRRRGRLAESIEVLQRAFSLDPRTVKLVWAIAETHRGLRNYEQADNYYAQAISLAPDQPIYWEERAMNRLAWTGDLEEARSVLKESPIPDHLGLIPISFQLDFYERKYERALARLSPQRTQELAPQVQARLFTLAAMARERLGDRQGALTAAQTNRANLEAYIARFPNEPAYRAYLAITLAQLGHKSEALAQAEQAVSQKRHDTFTGPRFVEFQAMVDSILGRRREATERLAWLLVRPYQSPIPTVDLELNPVWDPLRNDPRFENLLRQGKD